MTCKDCIHYDVCGRKTFHFANKLYRKDVNDIEKWCETLKDKSRFVELPCKVGDTVYYVANIGRTSRLLPFINEYSVFEITLSKRQIYFHLCHKNDNGKNEKVYHTVSIEKFNKNVFTDKSKAEAKLKELSKNG